MTDYPAAYNKLTNKIDGRVTKFQFKLIIIGDGGVGKTCLIQRFCFDSFNLDTKLTIGISFNSYYYTADRADKNTDIPADFHFGYAIWDCGGQDRFRNLIPNFISGADGVIMAFDNMKSLINLKEKWMGLIDEHTGDIPRILVQTKKDLSKKEEKSNCSDYEYLDPNVILEYMEKLGCSEFFQTSSLTNENVSRVFKTISRMIINMHGIDIDDETLKRKKK